LTGNAPYKGPGEEEMMADAGETSRERGAAAGKAAATRSPEERRQAALKAAAARSPEARWEAARKAAETRRRNRRAGEGETPG
jgi:hypothetical protein